MKVLLLIVALVAVAHARRPNRESYEAAETREESWSEERPGRPADDDSSADSADSYWTTTTQEPCPQVCPLLYKPVCIRDRDGVYRKFTNECMLRKCCCETGMEYDVVSKKKCRRDAPECPARPTPYWRPQPAEDLDVADSSASE